MRLFYAPRGLHPGMLRELLDDMGTTPAEIAKFLKVTERSVWRWLAEGSAPMAVIIALWHESPRGHYNQETDVGNHNNILRGLAQAHQDAHAKESARLVRVLSIGEFGSANDPLFTGPLPVLSSAMPYRWKAPPAQLECLPDVDRVDFL